MFEGGYPPKTEQDDMGEWPYNSWIGRAILFLLVVAWLHGVTGFLSWEWSKVIPSIPDQPTCEENFARLRPEDFDELARLYPRDGWHRGMTVEEVCS